MMCDTWFGAPTLSLCVDISVQSTPFFHLQVFNTAEKEKEKVDRTVGAQLARHQRRLLVSAAPPTVRSVCQDLQDLPPSTDAK